MAAEAAGDWGEAIGDWTAREEEKAALGTETRIWWINIWSFFFFFFWVTNTCRSSCCFPFSRVFRSTDVWESEVFDYICGTSLVSMNYISYGRSLTGMSASGMCIPTDGGCKLEPPNYNESRVWAQRRKKRDNRGRRWRAAPWDCSWMETDRQRQICHQLCPLCSSALPQDSSSNPTFPLLHPPHPSLVPSLPFSQRNRESDADECSCLAWVPLLNQRNFRTFHPSKWAKDAVQSFAFACV